MPQHKAVFLDRDGVINHDYGYVATQARFVFIEGVFQALRTLAEQGYTFYIVTNQSGIARGYFSEQQFMRLMDWVCEELRGQGIAIQDIYYCPHYDEGSPRYAFACDCRKPKPGMILKAVAEHPIDLSTSILIGDKESDIEAGLQAGVARCVRIAPENTNTQAHEQAQSLSAWVTRKFR